MNKLIKKAALLMAALTLVFVMVGCGGGNDGSEFVGTWNLVSMQYNEQSVTEDQIKAAGLEYKLVINEDGTAQFTSLGEMNWEANDDGINLFYEGEDKANGVQVKKDGDTVSLAVDQDGTKVSMEFEKTE